MTSVVEDPSFCPHCTEQAEPLLTLKAAAEMLGIPVSTLRKAVKRQLVPSYSLFNSRKRVKFSELQSVVASYKTEEGL